jgi:hypothetical protein
MTANKLLVGFTEMLTNAKWRVPQPAPQHYMETAPGGVSEDHFRW